MPDRSFDRTKFHPLEKPLTVDSNQLQSQFDRSNREFIRHLLHNESGNGFMGDGLKVKALSTPAMQVNVTAGLGFQSLVTGTVVNGDAALMSSIGGFSGIDDLEKYKPLILSADQAFDVPTAPGSPNSRIDIIEVKTDRRIENALTRQVLNPSSGQFESTSIQKTLAYALDGRVGTVGPTSDSVTGIGYKYGVPGNPPSVPATTSGYVKICEIIVGSGVTTITNANIRDFRKLLIPFGAGVIAARFDIPVSDNPAHGFPPAQYEIEGPPDMDIVLTTPYGNPALLGYCDIYVFGGDLSGLHPIVKCPAEPAFNGVSPAMAVTRILYSDITTIGGTDITYISDAAGSSNPSLGSRISLGQIVSKTTVQTVVQAAATTGTMSLNTYLGSETFTLNFMGFFK